MMVARACLKLELLSYAESTLACCHTCLPMGRPLGVQARVLTPSLKHSENCECLVKKIPLEVLDLVLYQ